MEWTGNGADKVAQARELSSSTRLRADTTNLLKGTINSRRCRRKDCDAMFGFNKLV